MAKINEQKVSLEEYLRQKIREAIVEEMMTLTEAYPFSRHEHGEPEHGESRYSPEEGEMRWSAPDNRWMDAHSWEQEFGIPEDPELEMDPENRERMMNSLLSMEFDENKQVHLEYLQKMIRENVKKYMRANSK